MFVEERRERHRCSAAGFGFGYDPEKGDPKGGIPPGTRFADLPSGRRCPVCGSDMRMFEPLEVSDTDRRPVDAEDGPVQGPSVRS